MDESTIDGKSASVNAGDAVRAVGGQRRSGRSRVFGCGLVSTLALFVFVCVRGLYIGLWAEKAKQFFSAYVAYGLSFLWIGQFLINIGVNTGLLPTKGLTLPFLSYGGSSLVICCVSLALLLRIEWERRTVLGSEDVEFSEEDFTEPSQEVAHAR